MTAPPALDQTGTQAAIYPSEEVLWASGPMINDPGDQGLAFENDDGTGYPPTPTAAEASEVEGWINEQLNGETSNGAYGEEWVNPLVYGPTGFGPWNAQAFETGHTQIVQADPGAEQGWGVGPARQWAHYPHDEAPNPDRNMGQHLRNGQLPWVVADSSYYERTQLAWEQQWAPFKHRSPVAPVVQVPASVPYVNTMPTYGGGPVEYPGIDYPIGPGGGIYW